jgi:hypothetical protein
VRAIVHVTDLVLNAPVDGLKATLEPIPPGYLKLHVPAGTQPGDEVTLVVKATVQSILPG